MLSSREQSSETDREMKREERGREGGEGERECYVPTGGGGVGGGKGRCKASHPRAADQMRPDLT